MADITKQVIELYKECEIQWNKKTNMYIFSADQNNFLYLGRQMPTAKSLGILPGESTECFRTDMHGRAYLKTKECLNIIDNFPKQLLFSIENKRLPFLTRIKVNIQPFYEVDQTNPEIVKIRKRLEFLNSL